LFLAAPDIATQKESDRVRIVVFSDTHGNTSRLEQAIFQQPRADYFIHLGDGQWDIDEMRSTFPGRKILNVCGNCDFAAAAPVDEELFVCGKRIFYTHGHRYYVKGGTATLIGEARSRKADIVLFGHTHEALNEYEDGLYIMNPGSLGMPENGVPTYGVIDITQAGIVLNIVEV
jgi:uncharacterized protein